MAAKLLRKLVDLPEDAPQLARISREFTNQSIAWTRHHVAEDEIRVYVDLRDKSRAQSILQAVGTETRG